MFPQFIEQLALHKVVPVIALEDASRAKDLAGALVAGGLPVAEVTFRVKGAAQTIETMAQRGDVLVGAGTVRNLEQAKAAQGAGASFLVTPGFSSSVVDWALEQDMPILPGIDSTLGLEMALERGLKTVKFFPATASGGLAKLKALKGPYGDVQFCPTGGICVGNLAEWLTFPSVVACGGSWLVAPKLLEAGEWEEVARLSAEAVSIASQVKEPNS
ncbi:MAG: bifunctional 4-hydroxy-2-oxoglutarate aldolase/2-dehydro-3-deoxy-phosphogluconate aldolase [Spirochaetales bacterium]|nr:bifunctional 4-hydroxy-2-oxoglutarate aldolase/2-dehydro-3-deoxy-phosphogluconate aldolase [Spirochaetales bacterium]